MEKGDTKYKVIAIKDREKGPDRGIVKIIFIYEGPDQYLEVDREVFKTGEVFISRGYDSISRGYSDGEFFILTLMDRNLDYDSSDLNKADWWSFGNMAERLPDSCLIPILETDLPDIGNGNFIPPIEIPHRRYFFLFENNIYGPFEVVRNGEGYQAEPYSKLFSIEDSHVIKVALTTMKDCGLIVEANEIGVEKFVTSTQIMKSALRGTWELVDYISDEKLIKYVNGVAKKSSGVKSQNPLSKKEISKLAQEIKEFSNTSSIKSKPRFERAKNILENFDGEVDQISSMLEELRSTLIGSLSSSNEGQYTKMDEAAEEISPEISKLEKEVLDLKTQCRQYESTKEAIIQEIDALQLKREEAKNSIGAEERAEKESEVVILNDKIDELKNAKLSLEHEYNEFKEKHEITKDYESVKRERDVLNEQVHDLKRTLNEIALDFQGERLGKEVGKLSTLLRILRSGFDFEESEETASYRKLPVCSPAPDDGNGVICEISDKLSEGGRALGQVEVANILICIQQNFLVFFQGRPGAGKTSSAIRLAKALSLLDSDTNRSGHFLNISVARGWVSSRDLLGFYNSLKGHYQPSRTGLYDFIRSEGPESNLFMKLVLLDEANLSPIEHYWSDFIGMCDPEGKGLMIDTGMPGEHRYISPNAGENLRFLATINNDSTTEPLSPRILDRAPVICMDEEDDASLERRSLFTLNGAIEAQYLERFFGRKNDAEAREDLLGRNLLGNFLAQATNPLQGMGRPIDISKRKEIALAEYIMTAEKYMSQNKAIDYGISQFVLPLIRGEQEGYKNRLEKMLEISDKNDLQRTSKLLQRILLDGDEYLQSYSFL